MQGEFKYWVYAYSSWQQKNLHAVQHAQKQLNTQFVMGFCSVVTHDSHVNVPPHRTNQVVQIRLIL